MSWSSYAVLILVHLDDSHFDLNAGSAYFLVGIHLPSNLFS